MLDAAPHAFTAWGAVSNVEKPPHGNTFTADLLDRTGRRDYSSWLEHISAASGCTRPVRLSGTIYDVHQTADRATVLGFGTTASMPDGSIYKACGNRRASVCPSCAKTYQQDAYQVIRAGIVGGKGIPDTVASHPSVFATFTAPGFGDVHTRYIKKHTCTKRSRCDCRPEPCHARHDTPVCVHGRPAFCFARHEPADRRIGKPICLDCYAHDHHVVWNRFAGELWRRTKQAIDRHLAKIAKAKDIERVVIGVNLKTGRPVTASPVRVSCGKAAEFQARAAVHFHVLLRLDGLDPHDPGTIVPPPAGLTAEDLEAAIRAAATEISFTTPAHPDHETGWPIAWGEQVDVRPVALSGSGEVTDSMVAGYLAKYATKSTEVTGHCSTRLTEDNVYDYANFGGDHIERLIAACWRLGRRTHFPKREGPLGPRVIPGLVALHTCTGCGIKTTLAQCEVCGLTAGDATQPPAETHSDGRDSDDQAEPYAALRRWAHMLGFGGHFLTKSRRYSVTFRLLRDTRIVFRRNEISQPTAEPADADTASEETTLVISTLTFAGVGWHTSADAMLANTAAAMAREKRQIARDELAHEIGSTLTGSDTKGGTT